MSLPGIAGIAGAASSGATVVPGVTYDTYWGNVVLLVGGQGANNSTSFTDESPLAQTVSVFGAAKVSTAQQKFGAGSLLCNVAATDYIQAPDNDGFNMGSGDFTMELWWCPIVTGNHYIIGQGSSGGFAWNNIGEESNALRSFNRDTGAPAETPSSWTINAGQWYHLVYERAGTVGRVYRDGVMVGTATMSGALTNATDPFYIGLCWPGAGTRAYIQEVRVTKGVARYNSNGGYAVPTAAFPRGGLPFWTVAPSISGNTWVGQTLTCAPGTIPNIVGSPTYQWKQDGSPIGGATASTYVLVTGDIGHTITCTVSAANANGTASTTATGVGPVTATDPLAAIRCSGKVYVNSASSAVFSLSSMTAPGGGTLAPSAGDKMVLLTGHGYGASTPSGWTSRSNLAGSNYNGAVFEKTLTSGDISTGSVTVSFAGSYYGTVVGVAFVGGTSGYRDIGASRNGAGASSRTVTSGSSPQAGDYLLLFGSARVNAAVTSSSLTSTLQSNTATESSAVCRFGIAGSSGTQSGTVNYAGSPSGDYQAIVAIAP